MCVLFIYSSYFFVGSNNAIYTFGQSVVIMVAIKMILFVRIVNIDKEQKSSLK